MILSTRFRISARMVALVCLCAVSPQAWPQIVLGQITCGPIKNAYGPYDYRVVPADIRNTVEPYHFTPDVETLRRGNTSDGPGGDLDYTLRAFPNSPRALMSVVRYANKVRSDGRSPMPKPFECYFDRALRFVPDDPTPHMIYAIYLRDRKRMADARAQLEEAERTRGDPSNFDLDYNLGLLFFEVGDYDKAAVSAKRAYALGAPFPSLKTKLQAKGKWTE